MKICVLLPALNEREGLEWFMKQGITYPNRTEALVIDGSSTDGTWEYCIRRGIPVMTQEKPGMSAALCEGLEKANAEIVIVASPDGNCLPSAIPALVEKIKEGHAMVIASRYLPPAKSYDDDFLTRLGNRFFTWLINFLFGSKYTDTLGMFRAYRVTAIKAMGLDKTYKKILLNSWEIASCCRAAKMRLSVAEIPVDEPKRIGGKRKMSVLSHGVSAFLQIVWERARWAF